MFNYSEVDASITIGDLVIVSDWLKSNVGPTYMVTDIKREQGKRIYDIHISCAQHGFNRKIKINDQDQVNIIEKENQIFWMS